MGHDNAPDFPAIEEARGPGLFKPRPCTAAIFVLVFLIAVVLATYVFMRPTGLSKPTRAAKPERMPIRPGIENGSLRQENGGVKPDVPHARDILRLPWWSGMVTLRGEIARWLKIRMHFLRKGSELSGSYSYERIGTAIPVRGIIDDTGSILLEEFVKGQKTGVFTGNVVSDTRIEGKWSKTGSTRSRDFFLVSMGHEE